MERKVEKRSIYVDMRDEDENDTMENWNEEKLKEVVEKKHGKEKRMPTTDIVRSNWFIYLFYFIRIQLRITTRFVWSTQVCKYFLDAVEKSKYGWFWGNSTFLSKTQEIIGKTKHILFVCSLLLECPNGEKCIYRHALPQGYILKKDKKKMDEQKTKDISLVDLIERERNALGSNLVRWLFSIYFHTSMCI